MWIFQIWRQHSSISLMLKHHPRNQLPTDKRDSPESVPKKDGNEVPIQVLSHLSNTNSDCTITKTPINKPYDLCPQIPISHNPSNVTPIPSRVQAMNSNPKADFSIPTKSSPHKPVGLGPDASNTNYPILSHPKSPSTAFGVDEFAHLIQLLLMMWSKP